MEICRLVDFSVDFSDVLMIAVASLDWMLAASSMVRHPWVCRKSMFARVCETRWETKAESDMGDAEADDS